MLEYKSWLYLCELLDQQLIILRLSFLISKIGRITFLCPFRLLGRLNEFLCATHLEQHLALACRMKSQLYVLVVKDGPLLSNPDQQIGNMCKVCHHA